jgi:hypothetical protein
MAVKMKNGKNYLTVVERMNMLLEEKGREDYSLETEVTYDSGVIIVKAILTIFSVNTDAPQMIAERKYCGHALGEIGKAKTLEATETHAIGRCLASAGWFGQEFASANEMESWEQSNQETKKPKKKKSFKPQIVDVSVPDKTLEDPGVNVEQVDVSLGKEVMDNMNLTFGKYKGKSMTEIGETDEGLDYLDWLRGPNGKENLSGWMKADDGSVDIEKIELIQKTADYFHYYYTGKKALTF